MDLHGAVQKVQSAAELRNGRPEKHRQNMRQHYPTRLQGIVEFLGVVGVFY